MDPPRPQFQLHTGQASLISHHHSDITGQSAAVQIENTEFNESNQNLSRDLPSLNSEKRRKKTLSSETEGEKKTAEQIF